MQAGVGREPQRVAGIGQTQRKIQLFVACVGPRHSSEAADVEKRCASGNEHAAMVCDAKRCQEPVFRPRGAGKVFAREAIEMRALDPESRNAPSDAFSWYRSGGIWRAEVHRKLKERGARIGCENR